MTFPSGNGGFSSNGANNQVPSDASDMRDFESTQVFTPMQDVPLPPQPPQQHASNAGMNGPAAGKRHHVWPWIVVALVVVLAGACAGLVAFFNIRALPGTTLWGVDVSGKTQQQIAQTISNEVDGTKIPVSYEGKTGSVTLSDLGVKVDAQQIAQEAVDAKRHENVFARYAPWAKHDVNPAIDAKDANPEVLDEQLGTNSIKPVDAKLQVGDDGSTITVIEGTEGHGADPTETANEAVRVVQSLGAQEPKTVEVQLKTISPAITTDEANKAKSTLDKLMAQKPGVYIGKERFAAFTPSMILAATTIDPNGNGTLPQGQIRNGNVVYDATVLQKAYDEQIKPNIKSTKEDREVIVNNNGTEIEVIKEGHDGVTLDDGTDANIGTKAIDAFGKGNGTVSVSGKLDPMKVKETKRHVVVDLSDHTVTALENGNAVKTMHMSAGQGNDYATGKCQASGDMCTPEGDFEIWLKYPSQNMSGTLTLSDGKRETWDVKNVGFVNYFSKSGCAIHRIATQTPYTDAQIQALGENTSHGCVGIGWDMAEWFYNWCVDGTSVHVQQ
ncbi:L,D-transpeptidase family protein [Bifidobacterium animalis]|uniref:L,D-transpeptidase catalytic domain-containing protein n=1 Tax=Bifidobacterium animalis subsp. lactis TaxID=302911 RepID=A0A8B3RHC1_BIFAN|nr:L,D-transpeptidase family protein [Bifidobacterium animalis]RYM94990.1 L,D-transpeptidase catalytic domain-containing protein [Bifidobacterium animalis subsp. lactis]